MLNLSTSQKPLFEIAHVATNALKEMTMANLQLLNTASKIYFDACSTCCKLGEEGTKQAEKTTTGK
jgi:hypothetical protein